MEKSYKKNYIKIGVLGTFISLFLLSISISSVDATVYHGFSYYPSGYKLTNSGQTTSMKNGSKLTQQVWAKKTSSSNNYAQAEMWITYGDGNRGYVYSTKTYTVNAKVKTTTHTQGYYYTAGHNGY